MLRILSILFILCWCCSCSVINADPRLRPEQWGIPIINSNLTNFYRIDDNLYRSAQPDSLALKDLTALGIKEILNLREHHSDDDFANTGFVIHHVPMEAGSVTEQQLLAALSNIKKRTSPLLIHCWHGADRTGVTVAAYRIVFQNWSKAQALDEMINGGYGYHASLYPNLVELINNLDVENIRQQLQIVP